MKAILGLVLLFSFSAQADIIKCTFTEPFVSFDYSMTQSSMTITDSSAYPTPKVTIVKNVSFQILAPGTFQLRDKNNNVLVDLHLDFKGSDGMSDNEYPYTAYWKSLSLWGGCSSNFLATKTSPN